MINYCCKRNDFCDAYSIELLVHCRAQLTESGKINESIYRDSTLCPRGRCHHEYGRNLLESARQLGINKTRASLIEKEFTESLIDLELMKCSFSQFNHMGPHVYVCAQGANKQTHRMPFHVFPLDGVSVNQLIQINLSAVYL